MANVPATVTKRLTKQVPRYQRVLKQKLRDISQGKKVSEADTVTIVIDMLNEVFGFDKHSEITQEHKIKRDFCDVAVKIEGKVRYLIEVKAIGTSLKDNHIKQAVNYGANAGIEWVVLTNGVDWQVYRIVLESKEPPKLVQEQICALNFIDMKAKTPKDQETLFLLCKRGVNKTLFEELYEHQQVVNKHTIAALMMFDEVVHKIIVRELKKLGQNAKPDKGEIAEIIKQIIMPGLVVDEKTESARKEIDKTRRKLARTKEKAARAANENKVPQEEE